MRAVQANGVLGMPPGTRVLRRDDASIWHGTADQRGMPMMMGRGSMMGYAPRLNGQHAAYIIGEWTEFATGGRQSEIMNRSPAGLNETDRKAVAAYLSGLH